MSEHELTKDVMTLVMMGLERIECSDYKVDVHLKMVTFIQLFNNNMDKWTVEKFVNEHPDCNFCYITYTDGLVTYKTYVGSVEKVQELSKELGFAIQYE